MYAYVNGSCTYTICFALQQDHTRFLQVCYTTGSVLPIYISSNLFRCVCPKYPDKHTNTISAAMYMDCCLPDALPLHPSSPDKGLVQEPSFLPQEQNCMHNKQQTEKLCSRLDLETSWTSLDWLSPWNNRLPQEVHKWAQVTAIDVVLIFLTWFFKNYLKWVVFHGHKELASLPESPRQRAGRETRLAGCQALLLLGTALGMRPLRAPRSQCQRRGDPSPAGAKPQAWVPAPQPRSRSGPQPERWYSLSPRVRLTAPASPDSPLRKTKHCTSFPSHKWFARLFRRC